MKYLLTLFIILLVVSCQDKNVKQFQNITGNTMGTTYSVQYYDSLSRDYKVQFDSLLILVNESMSTYDPNSTISLFNTSDAPIFKVDKHFANVFELSKKIYAISDAHFNPTIYPLVKYWGFAGGAKPQYPDSTLVDSLLSLCDFNQLSLIDSNNAFYVKRKMPNIQLDFSAIAKGYGVDLLSLYLEKLGVNNYLVEIGGEVRLNGFNPDTDKWTVGIDNPLADIQNRKLAAIISEQKGAIATSGNYRNFYTRNGQRYVHILNPKTGFPYESKVLSATVLADNCAEADALATALMIGGKSLYNKIEDQKKHEILLIESIADDNGEAKLLPLMNEKLAGKTKWLVK